MKRDKFPLLTGVAEYYSSMLREHGETPRGVDWNGQESQRIRFAQLSKVIEQTSHFSINDLGCGYGALFDFLLERHQRPNYTGIDVSKDMIRAARQRYRNVPNTRFSVSSEPDQVADYSIASGIFNVRLNHSSEEWDLYIQDTLEVLNRSSRMGFAFNCLTSYSDNNKMLEHLHYADPCRLFDLCKRKHSQQVALLHDYGLFEFTILVRKQS